MKIGEKRPLTQPCIHDFLLFSFLLPFQSSINCWSGCGFQSYPCLWARCEKLRIGGARHGLVYFVGYISPIKHDVQVFFSTSTPPSYSFQGSYPQDPQARNRTPNIVHSSRFCKIFRKILDLEWGGHNVTYATFTSRFDYIGRWNLGRRCHRLAYAWPMVSSLPCLCSLSVLRFHKKAGWQGNQTAGDTTCYSQTTGI